MNYFTIKSDGGIFSKATLDVYFDFHMQDGKAKVGSHVSHSQKILHPADRVENNQCIYILDENCIGDVKNFYNNKTNTIINVNPNYYDFKVLASDSLIMTMMRGYN